METKIKRTYYPNGELNSELPYVGGKLHGVGKSWYHGGQLGSEYPYVDGKTHGMGKQWDPDGGIRWFCLYNQSEHVATFYPRNETQKWKLK
jgi:antitoxin component YwqK of YwqJK toxin-antitoxin module